MVHDPEVFFFVLKFNVVKLDQLVLNIYFIYFKGIEVKIGESKSRLCFSRILYVQFMYTGDYAT